MPERLNTTAEQIMSTDIRTLTAETPLKEAMRVLADEDVQCVVVVDDDGRPQGILTEGDLLRFAEESDDARMTKVLHRVLEEEHHIFDTMRGLRKASATTVGQIASKPVKCADVDTTVGKLASIMETYDYRQLPVVKDDKLVGLVGRQEIIRAIADRE